MPVWVAVPGIMVLWFAAGAAVLVIDNAPWWSRRRQTIEDSSEPPPLRVIASGICAIVGAGVRLVVGFPVIVVMQILMSRAHRPPRGLRIHSSVDIDLDGGTASYHATLTNPSDVNVTMLRVRFYRQGIGSSSSTFEMAVPAHGAKELTLTVPLPLYAKKLQVRSGRYRCDAVLDWLRFADGVEWENPPCL
jgi:hypothetical protein